MRWARLGGETARASSDFLRGRSAPKGALTGAVWTFPESRKGSPVPRVAKSLDASPTPPHPSVIPRGPGYSWTVLRPQATFGSKLRTATRSQKRRVMSAFEHCCSRRRRCGPSWLMPLSSALDEGQGGLMVPSREKPKARLEANTPQCPKCKTPMRVRILIPRPNVDDVAYRCEKCGVEEMRSVPRAR